MPPKAGGGLPGTVVPVFGKFARVFGLELQPRSFAHHEFVVAAEALGLIAAYDPDDDNPDENERRRVLAVVKCNIAPKAASLGYWIGGPFARQGIMTETLTCLMPFLFDRLGLHRVEAVVRSA